MIKSIIDENLIDFIAMDIKHKLDFTQYNNVVGNSISENAFSNIKKTIDLIQKSNIGYEFRTTIAKGLHSNADVLCLISEFGENYKIQNFNPEVTLNPSLQLNSFPPKEFQELLLEILEK